MFCRDKTTNLRQKTDDGGLSQNCWFTRHVGTCNHHNLLCVSVKENIIWNVFFAKRQGFFYHRMSSFLDVYCKIFIDNRFGVVFCNCKFRKSYRAVYFCNDFRVVLNGVHMHENLLFYFFVEQMFQLGDFFFRSQYLWFVFFQFFCDVPLCIDQSLFSYPVFRNLVFMRVSDFYVISENIIEIYF